MSDDASASQPDEQFLYTSYFVGKPGEAYYKRVRAGFLRFTRVRFEITCVETEAGVFRDYETQKIFSRRYNHFGVPAE